MGRMAYPAPGVNLLRKRSLLAKPLPRAECVALGNARAVLYAGSNYRTLRLLFHIEFLETGSVGN